MSAIHSAETCTSPQGCIECETSTAVLIDPELHEYGIHYNCLRCRGLTEQFIPTPTDADVAAHPSAGESA